MSTPGSNVTGTKVNDGDLKWEWVDTYDPNTPGDYEIKISYTNNRWNKSCFLPKIFYAGFKAKNFFVNSHLSLASKVIVHTGKDNNYLISSINSFIYQSNVISSLS